MLALVFGGGPLLDVHAPHEKIHGIGDFFLHLFTITVGLLIALGLEAVAERVHHRHQRDEADVSLRHEIADNQRELKATLKAIPGETQTLEQLLQMMRERTENKAFQGGSFQLGLVMGSFSDAGWQTASATGVVSYMEYDRAKEFASAYQAQEAYNRLAERALDQFLLVESYLAGDADPTKMPPETSRLAVADVQKELAFLLALQQLGASLEHRYDEVLQGSGK